MEEFRVQILFSKNKIKCLCGLTNFNTSKKVENQMGHL